MGDLMHTAGAIVDYVYALEGDSCFEESSRCEWVLRPRNWIALHFCYSTSRKRFHISLDYWPGNLESLLGLVVKKGRFPSWSKFTVENVEQLPGALQHIWRVGPTKPAKQTRSPS